MLSTACAIKWPEYVCCFPCSSAMLMSRILKYTLDWLSSTKLVEHKIYYQTRAAPTLVLRTKTRAEGKGRSDCVLSKPIIKLPILRLSSNYFVWGATYMTWLSCNSNCVSNCGCPSRIGSNRSSNLSKFSFVGTVPVKRYTLVRWWWCSYWRRTRMRPKWAIVQRQT